MGFRNAPDTSQSLMNEIFRDGLDDFRFCYLDDLLNSEEGDICHFSNVLQCLQDNSLYVRNGKFGLLTDGPNILVS